MRKYLYKSISSLAKYGWPITLAFLGVFALAFTWSSPDRLYSNIRLFDRIALTVSENYVDEINEEKMIGAGIDAMLSKLDNYTKFLRDADYVRLRQETESQFEGIGVSMEFHRDTLTVVSVFEGAPGYRMGLKAGDRVLKIDSTATYGLDSKKVRMLMWGPSGTEVELLIQGADGKQRRLNITREDVDIESIPFYSMLSDKIGYIRIIRFSEGCRKEVKTAIADLKKKGMKALILDLRDNPGGLLLEAVEIAGFFLPSGSTVVETRGRNGNMTNLYKTDRNAVLFDGDLAVIVDEQTASAAEILAGAIQDHDRGIIIGEGTYGKGLVQQVIQFSDNSALKITTSRYYLPSGRCLQKPDWSTFELTAGNAEKEGDTLFHTVSGRPVYGGGGIAPDICLDYAGESDYVTALKQESAFFDFTIEYLNSGEISPGFRADDQVMSDFRNFIAGRDFAFMEEDRIAFNLIKEKFTVIDDETQRAFRTLENGLNSSRIWRFDDHYAEIMSALDEEIILRTFGEKALYERLWIKENPEIAEAAQILADSEKYLSILASR